MVNLEPGMLNAEMWRAGSVSSLNVFGDRFRPRLVSGANSSPAEHHAHEKAPRATGGWGGTAKLVVATNYRNISWRAGRARRAGLWGPGRH